jgi:hypothetical protein
MPEPSSPPLPALMTGFWISQSIYAAAKLDVAGHIHEHGPQTAEQLAALTKTRPDALYRLLRALASVGIFREDDDRRFALTPSADLLRSGVEGSQRSLAIMMGEEHFASWGQLMHSLQTGQSAFEQVFGEPVFNWLSKHPEQAKIFDEAMVGVHGRETGAMLDAYDFSGIGVVADVGGGNGSVLRSLLARYPAMRGMLCDLPGVIERAAPAIAAAGLSERLRTVATDFFREVPSGADAYLMRHIIHDWTDQQAIDILRNVRRAMGESGRLLVIESVILPGNHPDFAKLLDLNMLVIPGGKERTRAEFEALYSASGFRLAQITDTHAGVSVIEGRPS